MSHPCVILVLLLELMKRQGGSTKHTKRAQKCMRNKYFVLDKHVVEIYSSNSLIDIDGKTGAQSVEKKSQCDINFGAGFPSNNLMR